MGWGLKIDNSSFVSLLLFADNFWLVATNPIELQNMTAMWLKLLSEAGWQAPIGEMTWCTTGPDDQEWSVVVQNQNVTRSSRQKGFKALGVIISFDNQYDLELDARIQSAWKNFYKYRELLCCKTASLSKRMALLKVVVHPVLFWCAGSWNLRANQLSKLRDIQSSMLRKILDFRRGEFESLGFFMQRTATVIRNLRQRHCCEGWDAHYHRLHFMWGGYVAQL